MINAIDNKYKNYIPSFSASSAAASQQSSPFIPKMAISYGVPSLKQLKADTFTHSSQVQAAPVSNVAKVNQGAKTDNVPWKNDLRDLFGQNKSVIYALIIRTFNADDKDGNGLINLEKGEKRGNFINAIDRLDELKSMGINTLHVLPIGPPAKKNAMGIAGCPYAADSFTEIDPALADPKAKGDVYAQAKKFVNEAHKRNIRVMIDLPSCSSVEFADKHPDLIAYNNDGTPKVPQGWDDVRSFKVWENEDKQILNKPLMDMHKQYVDMVQNIGADGIRADVARYKPAKFWNELISYSREKNPKFGWLAETYTYEDASPMANIPADRPEDLLNAGFDTIYGQYHIFPQWKTATEVHNYVKDMVDMSRRLPANKSLIGSFATHDDKSAFSNGGAPYSNMTVGLQATLPMVNPYFVSGFESGDRYIYPYRGKYIKQTDTDSHIAFAHPEWIDIFNYSRKPGGTHPEIGTNMGKMFKKREQYEDVITKGSYIPLKVKGNDEDSIFAYTRHYKGKTLLAIANLNVNGYETGRVVIPGLKKTQRLTDLSAPYGVSSRIKVVKNALDVDLGPARFHLFEIDTPNIEKMAKDVYRPNQKFTEEAKPAESATKRTTSDIVKLYHMLRQKNRASA